MYNEKEYKNRLIDAKIDRYLKLFGAIVIEGPKWVGKTWTSLKHSNCDVSLAEKSYRDLAKSNPKNIIKENKPELIDEWQLVPEVWDVIRNECDIRGEKGNFILTGSTTLKREDKEKIFHSGAGRFSRMKMYPMSLYESNDSNGQISLMDLYDNKEIKEGLLDKEFDLKDLARLCIRGGFPSNLETEDDEDLSIVPYNYITALCEDESNDIEGYSPHKLKSILLSLARNESTLATKATIMKDVCDDTIISDKREMLSSRSTLDKYLEYLERIFVTDEVHAYNTNYRSTSRLGKNSKKHLVDPSLVCALLNINIDKLIYDHKVFGYIFESLVLRDLRIYMNYLDGDIYHFRDNLHGDEVDVIMEFKDGTYGACEVKLTHDKIDDAKKSLMKFYNNVKNKPKFMCIICGDINYVVKDKETGIYIMPLTVLKP